MGSAAQDLRETVRRERAREIALFRFGVIQDALDPGLTAKQRGRLVRSIAQGVHPGPSGVPVRVSRANLDRWLRAYRTGGFTALPDLTTALLPKEAPSVGGGSLFVDLGGQVHLAYHFNTVPQHSTPVYHALAGSSWTARKTIDNGVLDGFSGFSARIAVFGTKKYALYYFRKAGQSIPVTADLRLASWDGSMDMPVIEILDQQIPSDDAQYPVYRAAMAIDKYGLVHFAQIRPSPNVNSGFLEYRRQTRLPGGGTKWLTDIVDPDVISNLSQAYVDLVVDDNARPHIAYISSKDGKVKYATRFDR